MNIPVTVNQIWSIWIEIEKQQQMLLVNDTIFTSDRDYAYFKSQWWALIPFRFEVWVWSDRPPRMDQQQKVQSTFFNGCPTSWSFNAKGEETNFIKNLIRENFFDAVNKWIFF